MKSTGVVRRIDELGRFVVPSEIRKKLNMDKGVNVEILVDGNDIILRRYADNKDCIFCSSTNEVKSFKGKYICKSCLDELL